MTVAHSIVVELFEHMLPSHDHAHSVAAMSGCPPLNGDQRDIAAVYYWDATAAAAACQHFHSHLPSSIDIEP